MAEPEQRMRKATEQAAGGASVHDVGEGRIAHEYRHGDERHARQTDDLAMLWPSHANTQETTMTKMTTSLFLLALAGLVAAPSVPALAQNQHMEIIHHPNY